MNHSLACLLREGNFDEADSTQQVDVLEDVILGYLEDGELDVSQAKLLFGLVRCRELGGVSKTRGWPLGP